MRRDTDLSRVMFPVEVRPAYYRAGARGRRPKMLPLPNTMVVVNLDCGSPLGVVSPDYRLVTNAEALRMGKECLGKLFKGVNPDILEVFNVIYPATRSFCQIDLIQKGYQVNIWKQEVYLPFLRVTNSYNRTRALSFDVGFCRELCDNGMIFEEETIGFRFDHTEDSFRRSIEFAVKPESLQEIERRFTDMMGGLRDVGFPRQNALPLLCKVMGERFDLDATDGERQNRERRRFEAFRAEAGGRIADYFGQLGDNGYERWMDFGDSPFIRPDVGFSARDYAKERCAGICQEPFKAGASEDTSGAR